MDKVKIVEGVAAHFRQPNIDTDAIISVKYQRSLEEDPGIGLFGNWRYNLDGTENPEFILNQEPYRSSRIIVGGHNFGCGSSREFAVWAMYRFGIRCIIAESFGDIFYENSFKNGLLLITLPPDQIDELQTYLERANDPRLSVDLETCAISLAGRQIPFEIPRERREALLQGLDEIAQTLSHEPEIADLQQRLREEQPWIFPASP